MAERLVDEHKEYEVLNDGDAQDVFAEKMEERGASNGMKQEQHQQQPSPAPAQQQQPQLSRAAAPNPWPPVLLPEVLAALEEVDETEEQAKVIEA